MARGVYPHLVGKRLLRKTEPRYAGGDGGTTLANGVVAVCGISIAGQVVEHESISPSQRRSFRVSDTSPDFKAIFEQVPANYVVVDMNWRIVAVTDGYLQMTSRKRDDLVGEIIFNAFPDNPNDPSANGTSVLRQALETAAKSKAAEWLPGAQRYPVERRPEDGGGFEERWFRAVNAAVLDESGTVSFVIHGNEDVTEQCTTEA